MNKKLFRSAKGAYSFIERNHIERWELIASCDPDFKKITKGMKIRGECFLLRYNWRKVFLLSLLLKAIRFIFNILDLDYNE
jgi:hypothetical protein